MFNTRTFLMQKLKGSFIILLLCLLFFTQATPASAQCPMCKASVESNLARGETKGAGLNKGILFLLIIPYLAAGTLGFIFYRNYQLRKKRQASYTS